MLIDCEPKSPGPCLTVIQPVDAGVPRVELGFHISRRRVRISQLAEIDRCAGVTRVEAGVVVGPWTPPPGINADGLLEFLGEILSQGGA